MNKFKKVMCLSIGLLSVGTGVGFGFLIQKVKLTKNFITNERMNNSVAVSTFVNNIGQDDFIDKYDFDKSFKLIDADGKEFTDYSSITIAEAYKNNYFKFILPSKVKFYAEKYGISVYTKEYVKEINENNYDIFPTHYNSSTPEIKIWFGKGSGANKAEDYITITNSGFYGFKKTEEETDVVSLMNVFNKKFSLKSDFYIDGLESKGIKPGIYAKNIKKEDIQSNMNSTELNGVNWKITNLSQDPQLASKLIITFDFNKGTFEKNYYSETYKKFEINGFDIEFGIDDSVSKVKNFIKDENNISGLYESFIFLKPEDWEKNTLTIRESYEKSYFDMVVPPSYQNKASNAGVEYIFKKYDSINRIGDSVFPKEDNSTLPNFKVFVRAGSGTGFEYEESFILNAIEGSQDHGFKETKENEFITKLKNWSDVNESIDLKINLIGEFAGIIEDSVGMFPIPADLIAKVINPEKNIELSMPEFLPDEFPTTPEKISLTVKNVSSPNNTLVVLVNFSIGTEFVNRSSFNKTFRFNNFKENGIYNNELIDEFIKAIEINSNEVSIVTTNNSITVENKEIVLDNIKKGDGGYYFQKNIFVGYNEIINEKFKWSQKPKFTIDFSGTEVIETNINFKINIQIDNISKIIFIKKDISFFY